MLTDSSFDGANPIRDIEPSPSVHMVRSGERISRSGTISLMGLAASVGSLGLSLGHARRSFGDLGRAVRKVRPNLNLESTIYRSRGRGNQHTPPNYPKTRRKRKTTRERLSDRVSMRRDIGWDQ